MIPLENLYGCIAVVWVLQNNAKLLNKMLNEKNKLKIQKFVSVRLKKKLILLFDKNTLN